MIDYFKNIKLILFDFLNIWILLGWWYWWHIWKVWSRGPIKLIIIIGWELNLILAYLGLIVILSAKGISKRRLKIRNIIKLNIVC